MWCSWQIWEKSFFPFSNEEKVVPSNRSFGWSWHSIAKPFSFIKKDQGHRIQVNNLVFLLWALWDWILKGNQRMCMILLEELRVFTKNKQRECLWFRYSFHLRLNKGSAPSLRIFPFWKQTRGVPLIWEFLFEGQIRGVPLIWEVIFVWWQTRGVPLTWEFLSQSK